MRSTQRYWGQRYWGQVFQPSFVSLEMRPNRALRMTAEIVGRHASNLEKAIEPIKRNPGDSTRDSTPVLSQDQPLALLDLCMRRTSPFG